MKKNILIILIGLAMLSTSCTNMLNVDEINPNAPSVVAPKLVLPGALNQTVMVMDDPLYFEFVPILFGQWSVIAGFTQPPALLQYNFVNTSYQGIWSQLYTTAVNFDNVDKSVTSAQDCYYSAIAKTMKSYIFQVLVDCYGNVPYSQAFQTPSNLNPGYDDAQTIYKSCISNLDAAITLIQNAPVNANAISAASDIMYGGNMYNWMVFANTVKLRMLMHMAYMTGASAYIAPEIAKTASVGYMSAGQSALVQPGYIIATGKMNPFFEIFFNSSLSPQPLQGLNYYMAGSDMIKFMLGNNDPRIGKFFQTYDGTHYAGNLFSNPLLTPSKSTSALGYSATDPTCLIGSATKSAPLFTDFEALFVEAEAAIKGTISGDAKGLYQSAITQSFLYMGQTALDASNYYLQANKVINWDSAHTDDLKLQMIINQKWVALQGIAPLENWTDWRRTGYPTGIHWSMDPNVKNPTPPVRLLYPQTEVSYNNASVVAVGNISEWTTKIFWQNR